MLNGIHFLLTYMCSFECDHCFLYCTPHSQGTFTVEQIKAVLDDAVKIGTVEWIYFEGGEPFLYYPLLIEGIRLAKKRGFKVGIVSNSYWATSEEDAGLWLQPLGAMGIDDLSLSDDAFHQGDADEKTNTAKIARRAAERLGLPVGAICIEAPKIVISESDENKGKPVVGGGSMLRGRAVDKLIHDLPRQPSEGLTCCPHEELEHPERVHIDALGNVHICQGISMGNMWETPLSEMVRDYRADEHPICGPLIEGGPDLLARKYEVEHEAAYVDACHFCFMVRKALMDRFPEYLTPRQVYGLE
jgi:hypothetical protein